MTFNVCICGRPIEHGARECDTCASMRVYDEFLSGDLAIEYGDDPLEKNDLASQSSHEREPIRQPVRKHGKQRRIWRW